MKTFIIAMCLFSVLCAFVFSGAYYISNICEELEELSRNLPSPADELSEIFDDDFDIYFGELSNTWQKYRPFIRFATGHSESEAVDDLLDDIRARHAYGDYAGYVSAKRLLSSSFERIKNNEELSGDCIF